MEEEGLVDNARRLGEEIIGPELQRLKDRHPSIGDVRGVGCFWAVELVTDRATKEPLAAYGGSSPAMNEVIGKCKELGLIVFANFNRIHVVPPLNTSDEIVREGLSILDQALTVADEHAKG
jgi:taurine--2-oxoglutarate transaminase